MATLIAVYDSSGLVGRCDAKCYNAGEPDCDCICHGLNHGAGKDRAREQTAELAEQWIDQARKTNPQITSHEISLEAKTPTLF